MDEIWTFEISLPSAMTEKGFFAQPPYKEVLSMTIGKTKKLTASSKKINKS